MDDFKTPGMPQILPASRRFRVSSSRRVATLLLPSLLLAAPLQAATLEGFDELPQPAEATDGFAFRAAISGNTALVSDHANNRVHVYTQDADGAWSRTQLISSPTSNGNAQFGRAMAVQGDRAVIGAYHANRAGGAGSFDGVAYVYERSGGSWSQTAELSQESDNGQCFGWSVALDGDAILVGKITSPAAAVHSPTDCGAATGTNGHGAAYLFRLGNSGWTRESRLQPIDGSGNADGLSDGHYGFAVSLDGDFAVVSSDHHDVGLGGSLHGEGGYHTGKIYVYQHNGAGSWPLEDRLAGDDAGDHFGYDVALQGETLLVGARRVETNATPFEAGAAFVYQREAGGNWQRQQQIDPPGDGQERGLFGNAVELSGDYALIGELQDDAGSFFDGLGEAHLYQLQSNGDWSHLTSAFDSPLDAGDTPARFGGNGLGMSARGLIVGADEASGSSGIGRAFAYNREPYSFSYSEVLALQPWGYWQLDETFGSDAWDASGWRHDGVIRNGVVLGGSGMEDGTAAEFDGNNDEIEISAALGTQTQASLSAWLNATGSSGLQMAVGAADEKFLAIGIDHAQSPAQIVARAYGAAGNGEVSAGLPSSGWHHVAAVFDGGGLTLYIDGVQAASGDMGFTSLAATGTLFIGRGPDTGSGGDHFAGSIDEVAVFPSALSAAQVQTISDAPSVGALPLAITDTGPSCAPSSCNEDSSVSGVAVVSGGRNPQLSLAAGSVTVAGQSVADSSISLNTASGSWSYTPENREADYTVAFTLRADSGASSVTAAVSFNVVADNDPPSASQDISRITDDITPVGGDMASDAGISDPDSSALSYRIAPGNAPAQGSASVDANSGVWQYTPVDVLADYDAAFSVSISDGNSEIMVPVSVAVTALNLAPTATSASFTLNEDSGTASALPSVSDEIGDSHSFAIITQPANGTAAVVAGELRYTPDADFSGSDDFTFRATDSGGGSVLGTASVTVNPINDPPVASLADIVTAEDTSARVTPAITDPDSADTHTLSITTPPSNGSLSIEGGDLIYVPAANYVGSDNFSFRANDGQIDSDVVNVGVSVSAVNDLPSAAPLAISTNEDTSGRGTPVISDADPADTHTLAIASQPANGSASVDNGELVYQPAADFSGSDSFTFTVDDGTASSAAVTASVTVKPINDAPSAAALAIATDEDTSGRATPVISDADPGDTHTLAIASQPANGTASVDNGELVYQPAADFSGADSFTFTVSDGALSSAAVTASVTVNPINDVPSAAPLAISTDEDVAARGTPLISDADSGDTHTLAIASQPANGTASVDNGELVYQPAADFAGSDSFTFTVSDGVASSVAVSVSVTVNPINDAPSVQAVGLSVNEDNQARVSPLISDADSGDTHTLQIASQPTHGSASVAGGELVYLPVADYFGADSFTFTVSDGTLSSAAATASIVITAVNDAPTAASASVSVAEDGAEVAVAVTVIDVDDDAHSLSIVSQPLNGSARALGTQLFYRPAAGFNGRDSFEFRATDASGAAVNAVANVAVGAVNDAPSSATAQITLNEDGEGRVVPTVVDVDDSQHSFEISSQPAHGTASVVGNELVYQPEADFAGDDDFTFRAIDTAGLSVVGTATVSVTPVNDAPSSTSASLSLNEDAQGRAVPQISDVDVSDTHSFAIVSQPAHGTASVDNGELVYQPAADFNGADSFRFSATDAAGVSVSGDASVLIAALNDAPQLASGSVRSLLAVVGGSVDVPLPVSDVDAGDSYHFEASGNAATLGTVSTVAGQLRFTASLAGGGDLRVEAVDAAGARSPVLSLVVKVFAADSGDSNADGISDAQAEIAGLDPDSADSDGDGVADALEIGDPSTPLDSDGDGIIDALESGAAADSNTALDFAVNAATAAALNLPELAGGQLQFSAEGAEITAHSGAQGLPLAATPSPADSGFDFPLGLLDFSVTAPSGTATVEIRYPDSVTIPANAVVRKLDAAGNWRTFDGAVIDHAAHLITLTLTDGDEWDRDDTVGLIRDPVGIAVARSVDTSGGGGGGGGAAGGLLLFLLAGVGLRAVRRD